MVRVTNKLGDCRDENFVRELFGSVTEFARLVEMLGDNFTAQGVQVVYDSARDIHSFLR